ncbi:MAG: hypothetical protein M1828_005982 [Chrysothrix sp. TS-e1954]|nr:MAG: hypothetical protein M1828_005982 [Chrysothrix sp. TS-e1954]
MSLSQIHLTSALRPSLLPNEALLFVQDAVGLYQGKAKLAEYQNGQTYLTTHRVCYVDNVTPREQCVAIDLKDVERGEIYAGFLKSSPKVTLVPKLPRLAIALGNGSSHASQVAAPPQQNHATWICTICSYVNPMPGYLDPVTASETTPLEPCLSCGIKPSLAHLLKASIASVSRKRAEHSAHLSPREALAKSGGDGSSLISAGASLECPRCTFQNHPSLLSCEICGASLTSQRPLLSGDDDAQRSSPGPPSFDTSHTTGIEAVKISFRAGGDKIFYERLRGALQQRKWLVDLAPPIPTRSTGERSGSQAERSIGIAGLERRGQQLRKKNEVVIGNAFDDLEALMASAKEIISLAESLAPHSEHAANASIGASVVSSEDPSTLLSQLNLTATRDMLSASSNNDSLYLTELARSLAEFLTDDVKGVLRFEGGIITLVDLWSIYNRARGGVELVSPADFFAATELFEKLDLPVRRRTFKSGLLAVQERSRTEAKTTASILSWLRTFREVPSNDDTALGHGIWGKGVTAQDAAERFGWSVGVAEEELIITEARGALCRETSLEGVRFWENLFDQCR